MPNINVTPGTGKTVATETISSTEYQQIKLIDSTAASTSPTGIASNPLQVTGANGTFPVTGTFFQATQPVSGTVAVTGVATEGTLDARTGSLTESAPGTDTASSGINGRLQRIAQRITSLITALGTPFQAGASIGNTTFASTQATAANFNATVVGTGTFAVQATLAAETTKVIGTVNIAASQTVGTVTNLSQMGGVAISLNTGVRDTGTQRVTIATNDLVPVTGTVAHDGVDSGAPVKIGGRARTSEITAVANDDRVDAVFTRTGAQITEPYAVPENSTNGNITTAMTGTTSTAVTGMGAPGAGLRNYIVSAVISNTHATIGTMINLQDGTGGTVIHQFPAGPAFGGTAIVFPKPIRQATANTGIFAVNVTTGASTFVSLTGYTGS